MSFARVYRGVWFGFVRFALLLAVVLCWVGRCLDSWLLLGLLSLLRHKTPFVQFKTWGWFLLSQELIEQNGIARLVTIHHHMCRVIVSFARVYPVGVWFDFVRSALLLAVVLGWVARCFDSCVLLGLLCFLRVTNHHTTVNKHVSGGC